MNSATFKPLVIRTNLGDTFFDYHEITRIEADGSRTFIYKRNGEILASATCISDLEKKLTEKTFFKSHRSHIINLAYISNYNSKTGMLTVDGAEVPLSRNLKQKFMELFAT